MTGTGEIDTGFATPATSSADAPERRAGRDRSGDQALRALFRPVRAHLWGARALGALGAAFGVAGLVLIGVAVTALLDESPSRAGVLWTIAAAGACLILKTFVRKLSFDVSHIASFRLETILRRDLAAHLGRVPLGVTQNLGSGSLKKVLVDDVRSLHFAVADATPMVGFAAAQPVFALIALGIIDWRLLLASLVVLPIIVIGSTIAMRDYAVQRKQYDDANEAVNEAVIEFVQGMPVVRTFDDGSTSYRRFTDRVEEFTRATADWQNTTKAGGVLTRIFLTPIPTLVAIGATGTWLTLAGRLDVGSLVTALIIGALAIESTLPLMYLSDLVRQSRAAAQRITEIMSVPPLPRPTDPRLPADSSIRLTDVSFRYSADAARDALAHLDLSVPAGSVCALVGTSGSGKSTIARLIPRFWDVTSGNVEVGGVDVRDIDPDVLLRHVGIVFQETFLVDDTIAANIRLGRPDATDEQVRAAAEAAAAHDFILELPDGYQTRVGERGGLLSGGQRQRITIARTLLMDTPIVVLDEATAFSDPENEAAIQQAVAKLSAGRTLVVIAHRLSTIVDADNIVVLDEGRIAEQGTHDELIANGGRYAGLWAAHTRSAGWELDESRTATTGNGANR